MLLLDVVRALVERKVPYAIAGGYAVALHGAVRGTLDVDLVVSLKPQSLEKTEQALRSIGLTSRIPVTYEEISKFRKEYIEKRNLIAWNFVDLKNPTRLVDIILTDDISNHKIVKKIVQKTDIKILSIPSLIKMKKISARPQDLEDIKALEKLK